MFDVEPASTMIELWSVIAALTVGFTSIVVSVALPTFQERRKQRRLVKTKSQKAYARLYAILERHGVSVSTTNIELSNEDLKELQTTVENNFDVLYETTLTAWRNRTVKRNPLAFDIAAGAFFSDILVHYARLDRRNPHHESDSQ